MDKRERAVAGYRETALARRRTEIDVFEIQEKALIETADSGKEWGAYEECCAADPVRKRKSVAVAQSIPCRKNIVLKKSNEVRRFPSAPGFRLMLLIKKRHTQDTDGRFGGENTLYLTKTSLYPYDIRVDEPEEAAARLFGTEVIALAETLVTRAFYQKNGVGLPQRLQRHAFRSIVIHDDDFEGHPSLFQ